MSMTITDKIGNTVSVGDTIAYPRKQSLGIGVVVDIRDNPHNPKYYPYRVRAEIDSYDYNKYDKDTRTYAPKKRIVTIYGYKEIVKLNPPTLIQVLYEINVKKNENNTKNSSNDWKEVVDAPVHSILKDWTEDNGIRVIIKRGLFSLCAYVGVKERVDPALSEEITDELHCHGGVTFSHYFDEPDNNYRMPEGYMWWGWDYAHEGDHTTSDLVNDAMFNLSNILPTYGFGNEKKWTVPMVEAEAQAVAKELAERLNI